MDTRKVLVLVGATLVVFYMIAQPAQAAVAITTLLGWLKDGGAAILSFLRDHVAG